MPSNAKLIHAQLAEIDRRYRRKQRRHSSPRQIVGLRLYDFARLFRSRYGVTLPDDDAGRDDIVPVLHHLASQPHPAQRCAHWLDLWAPWLTRAESNKIVAGALLDAHPWSADALAWRYRVTMEQRTVLGLTTIGAIDCNKAARLKARKARHRAYAKAWRLAKKAADTP